MAITLKLHRNGPLASIEKKRRRLQKAMKLEKRRLTPYSNATMVVQSRVPLQALNLFERY